MSEEPLTLIEVCAGIDAKGDPDEFTWDLFPLVPSEDTLHLQENGLPKVGTNIRPGMIIVGAIGKTEEFDPGNLPNAVEIQYFGRDHVKEKYGHMWLNKSRYADDIHAGVVKFSRIESRAGREVAVVGIQTLG
jgi:DNA-directed RNA polymerase subunit beta